MEKLATMKMLPESERPYERIMQYGAAALSDAELLAVIIKSGTRQATAVEVATGLLAEYGSLIELGNQSISDLIHADGIGKVKAVQIMAVCELGKRIGRGVGAKRVRISGIGQLGSMFLAEMARLNKEIFKVVLLDKKWQIIKDINISVGTIDQTIVHPREVFYEAVRHAASAVVLVHNHPSGDCEPSKQDLAVTARLMRAGEVMGIEVVDHFIIGNGTYRSLFQAGYMEHLKGDSNR